MQHLAGSLAPAEVFFQTAIENQPGPRLRVTNDCRRYFDFSHTRLNRPKTLTSEDLPAVFASGMDFARKFDETVDGLVLDRVDQHLQRVSTGA